MEVLPFECVALNICQAFIVRGITVLRPEQAAEPSAIY